MEVLGERPRPPSFQTSSRINQFHKNFMVNDDDKNAYSNDFVNRGMSPVILSVEKSEKPKSPRTLSKFANGASARPRIITWAQNSGDNGETSDHSLLSINSFYKSDKEDDFLYQNVSNTGANYIEYKLKGIVDGEDKERMRNSKNQSVIEVRQIKNKTVVKISIKDDSNSREDPKETDDVRGIEQEDEENPKDRFCLSDIYANLNASDPECDQTYENQDFAILLKSQALPKEPEEQVYENQMFGSDEITYENVCSGERSEMAFVRVKPKGYHTGTIASDSPYQKSRKVVVTISGGDKSEEIRKNVSDCGENEPGHKRAESLTSSGVGVDTDDSEDEESNISCDSLNSNELIALSTSEDHGYHTPENKTGSPVEEYQNIGFTCENTKFGDWGGGIYENVHVFEGKKQGSPPPPPPKPAQRAREKVKSLPKSLLRDIRARKLEEKKSSEVDEKSKDGVKIEEKTYEERQKTSGDDRFNRICAMDVDTDQFYKFHLFENREEGHGEKVASEEETFAGVKDYLNREKQGAIKSAKGTIRGVKNRVKAGIATFLQMQENKNYKDRDAGKIVVYSTTMGIVRETYHKCLKVKQILRTLMVKFEERDVFMSTEAQEEIRERMKCDAIMVPQVFVEGQHIGDAETIERLNESGELRRILKPYKSAEACVTCQVCGGYRLLPCSVCKGSKKSIHRNNFTAEFVALKCMNCDQVGLTKCFAC